MFFIDCKPFPYGEWLRKKTEYDNLVEDAKIFNGSLSKKQKYYQLIAGIAYTLNVIDIIFISKNFKTRDDIKKKLNVDYTLNPYFSGFSLKYNF